MPGPRHSGRGPAAFALCLGLLFLAHTLTFINVAGMEVPYLCARRGQDRPRDLGFKVWATGMVVLALAFGFFAWIRRADSEPARVPLPGGHHPKRADHERVVPPGLRPRLPVRARTRAPPQSDGPLLLRLRRLSARGRAHEPAGLRWERRARVLVVDGQEVPPFARDGSWLIAEVDLAAGRHSLTFPRTNTRWHAVSDFIYFLAVVDVRSMERYFEAREPIR